MVAKKRARKRTSLKGKRVRDAKTGLFVKKGEARRRPSTTVAERVKKRRKRKRR